MADATPDPGHIKGASFREFVAWYGRSRGVDRLDTAVAALPESLRRQLQPGREALGILAASWYPAGVVHSLLDELIRGVPDEERLAMAQQAAMAIMQTTLRGLYRVLFRMMASPELYARYGHRLWSMHYDSGEVELLLPDSTHLTSIIRNWRSHHPFICELNSAAAYPLFTEMGCVDVTSEHATCVSRGADSCRHEISWQAK